MSSISKKLERDKAYCYKATALAISDDLMFIGDSEGRV